MRIAIIFFLFFSCASNLTAQKYQNIKLKINEANSLNPINGATVKINPLALYQTSDSDGNVKFLDVPVGRIELEISAVGFQRQIIKEILLESSKELLLEVSLTQTINTLEDLVVTASAQDASGALMGIQSISVEQIMRYPATFFDPARLAMSLAGVNNTHDQSNGISVRGNMPEATQWRLEGIEIVNPNHFSNAGTNSDQATQTGGGTNIFSAQMLGNINFLTGAFPSEYVNGQGAIMDLGFRKGNQEKFQHTAQAGLVGIDLSSEGPLNKNRKSSYLINYRYSFTGILVGLGFDFGGEKMKFQDVSGNFYFPTKKLGDFSIYFMGGISSNLFSPPTNPTDFTSEKDLNSIDFHSRMGLVGLKNTFKINSKWRINTVINNSGLENLRSQYTSDPASNINYKYQARNILGASSALIGQIKEINIKAGLNLTHYFNEFNFINSDENFLSYDELIVSPYAKITNAVNKKLNYNLGIVFPYYDLSKSFFVEPRFALTYNINEKLKLNGAFGRHSQQPNSRFSYSLPYQPIRSNQFTLGSKYNLNQNNEIWFEIYYQSLFNLVRFNNQYVSILNGSDFYNFEIIENADSKQVSGRNMGVELNYKKYLNKGWFVLANGSIYKSEFLAFDNKFYQTRFSGNHTSNLTLGKEWINKSGKILGLNTRITSIGGLRDYEIDLTKSKLLKTTDYNFSKPLTQKNADYFRADLRIYRKKMGKRSNQTYSLDIQNLTNQQNLAFYYYDSFLNQSLPKYQLGLLPMLNYRWEF